MELKKFNPRDIVVPEVRVTSRFDDETLEQFKRALNADAGAVFIVCAMVDGRPTLIDGMHRLTEAINHAWPLIDVALVEGNMVDVLTMNLKLDHLRGRHPVSEMIQVIKALTVEYKMDSVQIAEKTKLTREYIEKLQVISQLTPLCLEALDQDRIKVGHAAALTRIKDGVRQEAVLNNLLMYHWTVKELEAYVSDVLNILQQQQTAPAAGPPRPPPQVKCQYCGELHDVTEIANPNTCRMCSLTMFEAVAEVRREVAAEALKKVKPEVAGPPPGPPAGDRPSIP